MYKLILELAKLNRYTLEEAKKITLNRDQLQEVAEKVCIDYKEDLGDSYQATLEQVIISLTNDGLRTIGSHVVIDDGHVPWLTNRLPDIDSKHWDKYKQLLAKGMGNKVIADTLLNSSLVHVDLSNDRVKVENIMSIVENKKDFIFVFDTSELEVYNIKYCFKISAFIYRLKKEPYQYLQKSIIIVKNNFIQHLLDLIFFIQSPVAPVYIVKTNKSINNIIEGKNLDEIKIIT